MAAINSEIESLKHDMEKAKQEMELLCIQLGETAVPWHKIINYSPSDESYSTLCNVIKENNEIESSITAVRTALEDVNSSDKEIEKSKLSVRNLDKRYETLVSSLGAIAVEAYNASKLTPVFEKCLEPYILWRDKLKRLQEKAESEYPVVAIVSTIRIKRHRKAINYVFNIVGRNICKNDIQAKIPGSRADHIIADMDKLNLMKSNLKKLIFTKQTEITQAQSSLQDMGALGMENRKLRELETKQKQVSNEMEELYSEYGTILANGIDKWLEIQSPEPLQKACLMIKDQMRRIKEQSVNLNLLELERDIEIHQAQSSQYSTQLSQLDDQIRLITKQQAELNLKLETEGKTIEALRNQQQVIADSL